MHGSGQNPGRSQVHGLGTQDRVGAVSGPGHTGSLCLAQPTITSPMLVGLSDSCSLRRPFLGPTPGPPSQAEGLSENSTPCTRILFDTCEKVTFP